MKHPVARDLMSVVGGFMRKSYGVACVASAACFATAAPGFTSGISPKGAIAESIPSN
jgi:hypothetical protein